MRRHLHLAVWAGGVGLISVSKVVAAVQIVDWISAGTTSLGTLGSLNVSLNDLSAGIQGQLDIDLTDLSLPPFSFAPAPPASEVITYGHGSDWTVTFDQPVNNLLVYLLFWRTTPFQTSSGTHSNSYEFDHPFTIGSGSGGATAAITDGATSLVGDTLVLTGSVSDFYNGILIFPGPITSLSLDSGSVPPGNSVGVTFGIGVDPVPESTTTAGGIALGAILVALGWHRRRDQQRPGGACRPSPNQVNLV